MIELRRRLVVLRGPGFTAVNRDTRAAVVRVGDPVRIRWVDPEPVMIAVPRREQVECFAAVNRTESAGV